MEAMEVEERPPLPRYPLGGGLLCFTKPLSFFRSRKSRRTAEYAVHAVGLDVDRLLFVVDLVFEGGVVIILGRLGLTFRRLVIVVVVLLILVIVLIEVALHGVPVHHRVAAGGKDSRNLIEGQQLAVVP